MCPQVLVNLHLNKVFKISRCNQLGTMYNHDVNNRPAKDLQSQTILLDSGFLFPHTPCPMLFCRFKKYRKKSRRHCSNIERGEAGEGFRLRVARDFWLRLYSLYMLGISMGLFQACHVIDFQKDIIKTAKRKQTCTTTGNYQ